MSSRKVVKYAALGSVYGVSLYLLCVYMAAPHVFWYDTSRILQRLALRFGQAGLAAEKAYGDAMERVRY